MRKTTVVLAILSLSFIFFIFIFSVTSVLALGSKEKRGTKAAQFLKKEVGAEAIGMGSSFVAATDDFFATYWNPAGLAQIKRKQLGFMHNESFQDIRHQFLGYVNPIGDSGATAISLSYLSVGKLERRDTLGISQGTFHPYDLALVFALANKFRKQIAVGGSAKYIRQQIDEESAQAFAFDIGIQYSLIQKTQSKFLLGANIQNFGTKVKFVKESFSLPLNIKVGGVYKLLDEALSITTDLNLPSDSELNLGVGVGYQLVDILHLRTGYKYNFGGNDLGSTSGLTAGLGIASAIYQLDYAFSPAGELGQEHRVSILVTF